jgi:hypothetical protein
MSIVKFHNNKTPIWQNASGEQVPVKFVPKTDKLKETLAAKLHKSALNVEACLNALHQDMNIAFEDIKNAVKAEYQIKTGKSKAQGKGSFTWFNFDKSLKVEADMNDIVKWDNGLMTEALELLNKYIDGSLTDSNVLIKELVNKAFANTKGMIDSGKVFQILRYEDKIKNTSFQKACQLMKQAQSIDRTKLYMRIWEKCSDGQYRNINLNFSSI